MSRLIRHPKRDADRRTDKRINPCEPDGSPQPSRPHGSTSPPALASSRLPAACRRVNALHPISLDCCLNAIWARATVRLAILPKSAGTTPSSLTAFAFGEEWSFASAPCRDSLGQTALLHAVTTHGPSSVWATPLWWAISSQPKMITMASEALSADLPLARHNKLERMNHLGSRWFTLLRNFLVAALSSMSLHAKGKGKLFSLSDEPLTTLVNPADSHRSARTNVSLMRHAEGACTLFGTAHAAFYGWGFFRLEHTD